MSDQVSHPYKTTGTIIVLQIWIFTLSDSKRGDKMFWTKWQQALFEFTLLLISSWIEKWFITDLFYNTESRV
jgi:hypothetical protein